MMPTDWKHTELGEVVEFQSGNTPSKANPSYWGGNVPWVTAKDMKRIVIFDSIDRLTEDGEKVASIAPRGSLLALVRGMTLHKDVPVCLAGRDVAFNQDIKALISRDGTSLTYLMYFLHFQKRRLMRLVDTAGHGTGRLDTELFKSVPVVIPELNVQNKIVLILRIWDEVVSKIEKLIEAKLKLRKGLMQQLLSGKWRFPGFTKSWQEVRLGDIFGRVTRKNTAGLDRVLTASGEHGLIDQKDYFNKSVSGESLHGYYHIKRGEFAYNRSAMKGYPYGAIKRLDNHAEGVLSTLYLCFSLTSKDQCSDFLMHYFEAGNLNRQLRKIVQVGSRAHGLLNVTAGDFFNVKLEIPGRGEQQMIASLLNDLDEEILLLKKLLVATKEQKKGLMQKLLTGKVRVQGKKKNVDVVAV